MVKPYVYLTENILEEGLEQNDVGVIIKEEINGDINVEFLRTQSFHNLSKDKYSKFHIENTGDTDDFKVCDRCYKRLDTATAFENNRRKKDNLITKRPSCRSCRKIKDGVKIPRAVKLEWESTRPENGSHFECPICKKISIVGVSLIVLDHDHQTGKVRGWICESCNTGIGRFDDDPSLLQNGIDWLKSKK